MCEAAAVLLRLCVRGCVEVSVTVTPRVSERARSLPLGGVCQGLELDVALTPGVCVVRVSDSSGGRELLLLLCDNSAAFCRHSHAVVLWNEARKGRAKSDRRCHTHTHIYIQKHIHRQNHTHSMKSMHCNIQEEECTHIFALKDSAQRWDNAQEHG